MKCPNCGKNLNQRSGMWTPETPDITYRKYICHNCMSEYTEIVNRNSYSVIRVDETPLNVIKERQSTLMEW